MNVREHQDVSRNVTAQLVIIALDLGWVKEKASFVDRANEDLAL